MILNEKFLYNVSQEKQTYLEFAQQQISNKNTQFRKDSEDVYDVFLSHSYLDKELVYALIGLFNDAGYSIYVDWIVDKQLDRSEVNATTADTLRKRMKTSKSLAYVATSNSSSSKWCPWELGYVDAAKNGRCAILPIMKDEKTLFKGQEYLGLYPYIDYEKTREGKYEFWVNDPESDKYVKLSNWLSGEPLVQHNQLR